MLRFEASTISDEGVFLGGGEIVVLEPETWTGKRFPLLAHIDRGERLANGHWIVLLYHHDCPQCLETLPRYEALAETAADDRVPSVALVEVPPFGPSDNLPLSRAHRARLRDTKDWFVQTPTEILLADGTVTAVRGAEELKSGDQKKGRDERIVGSESVSAAEPVVRRVHYQPGAEP